VKNLGTALRAMALVALSLGVFVAAVVAAARLFGWQAGPLYFLVALTPYFGLAMVIAAVAALALRVWWLALPAALIAALVTSWWIPAFRGVPSEQHWDLTVMTTNLQFGNGDAATVARAISDHDVDLLSVQELTDQGVANLVAAGISAELPYRMVRPHEGAAGTGLWSRYPISDRDETDDLIFENLSVRVAAPTGTLTFLAMHPTPPSLSDGNARALIFDGTRDFIAQTQGPAIAAGDFNATRDNVPLRELEAIGFLDAATAAGAGMVRTWPNDLSPIPPLAALDHVLTRDTPPAASVVVLEIPNTDHRDDIARL